MRMMQRRDLGRFLFGALGAAAVLAPAWAEEGMWTFDNLPVKEMQSAYHYTPSADWLAQVQQASVRVGNGCSGALVSADGLVLTNQHCIDECLAELATPKRDYTVDGFYAPNREQETRCPDLEIDQL